MITNGTYPKAMLGINRELFLIACSGSPTLVIMAVPVLHLRHDEYPCLFMDHRGLPIIHTSQESSNRDKPDWESKQPQEEIRHKKICTNHVGKIRCVDSNQS